MNLDSRHFSPPTYSTLENPKKLKNKKTKPIKCNSFPPFAYRSLSNFDLIQRKKQQKYRRKSFSVRGIGGYHGLLGTFHNLTLQDKDTLITSSTCSISEPHLSLRKKKLGKRDSNSSKTRSKTKTKTKTKSFSRTRTRSIRENRHHSSSSFSHSDGFVIFEEKDNEIVDWSFQRQVKQGDFINKSKQLLVETSTIYCALPSPKRRILTTPTGGYSRSFVSSDPNTELSRPPPSPRLQLRSLRPRLSITPDTSTSGSESSSFTPTPNYQCLFQRSFPETPPSIVITTTPPSISTSSTPSSRSTTPRFPPSPTGSSPSTLVTTPRSTQPTPSPISSILTPKSLQSDSPSPISSVQNENSVLPHRSLKDRYLKMFRKSGGSCNSFTSSGSSSSTSTSTSPPKMKQISPKRRRKARLRKLSSPSRTANRFPLKEKKHQLSSSTPQDFPISPHALVRISDVMSRLRKHDPLILVEETKMDKPESGHKKQTENIDIQKIGSSLEFASNFSMSSDMEI